MVTPVKLRRFEPTASDRSSVIPSNGSSERMRNIRQRDTAPELSVRRLVHALGARYRVCPTTLPGRPDLANVRMHWAIFVHGCFWHGHARCRLYRLPKSNSRFWKAKVEGNRKRDAKKTRALRKLGFMVLVVWQCQLRNPTALARRLRLALP